MAEYIKYFLFYIKEYNNKKIISKDTKYVVFVKPTFL